MLLLYVLAGFAGARPAVLRAACGACGLAGRPVERWALEYEQNMQLVVNWKSCATFRPQKIGVFLFLEVGWGILVSKRPGRDFPLRARGENRSA